MAGPKRVVSTGPALQTHVLHTITGLNVGGAETMLARYLGQLDPGAYTSTVLSLLAPGAMAEPVRKTGADVITIGMRRSVPPPSAIVRLASSISRTAPDLLHGWMYHGNIAASVGSMLGWGKAPVIWSVHHTLSNMADEKALTRKLVALSARLSSRTAAVSYCSRASAEDHERVGFDPRRTVVIPNGIDCDTFAPSHERRVRLRNHLQLPPSRLIVGHAGRAHPMKDQASLVQAIARILSEGADVQGVFLGEGHEHGAVTETARALGIEDRVTTLGVRSDVAELLPGMDVFALSSAWGEAFPLSVGEAMASCVPPVATDVGDTAWLVGSAGVVVPPRDPEALSAGIGAILSMQPDDRRALGERARRRVVENFSLPLYVRRHLDLYEATLAAARGRAGRTR